MIINGIEIVGGGGSAGSSGSSGTSGTSGVGSNGSSGSSGTSGTSGTSGSSGTSILSNRFITSTTTLGVGLEQVLNDMFVISTYNVSSFNATYSIAGNVFYNNAHLNILNTIWIDGVLNVEGDFTLGLPQNNSFENLISII